VRTGIDGAGGSGGLENRPRGEEEEEGSTDDVKEKSHDLQKKKKYH
jgi:hypothetical protein